MNLCDCYVTDVLGKPVWLYGRWWVRVRFEDDSRALDTTDIMLSSEEGALGVGVGFHFLA